MADKVLKEKRKQFVRSVGAGTINGLLDELLDQRVLNQEEMDKIRYENATVMDKARVLTDLVILKGHEASQIFINQICEEDTYLAKMLGFSSGLQSENIPEPEAVILPVLGNALQTVQNNPAKPEFPGPEGSLKLCPPETAERIWREKSTEIYPIMERSTRTRLALIICNTKFDNLSRRDGADADIRGMRMLLESLGYTVDVKENLTAQDMESVLWAFAARPEHRSSDSTFLVFMSHGILDGICGTLHSDEKPDVLPYDTIFRIFNNRNCLSLKDKPKVIIVQACRGANRGELWVSDSPAAMTDSSSQLPGNLEEDAVYKTHVEKDFIAFCSSTPHNVSWRDITKGSLFIAQLITCFQKYSWGYHLEEVFRMVQRSFDKPDVKAQMPTIERQSMTRYFYLFPGN
ncbi:caspase-1-like isoform 3-T4 [Hipposideros larvatus]